MTSAPDVMNRLALHLAPDAANLIRADHAKVLALFHRYRLDAPPARKQALAEAICLALEVHARLEEEIFYPAMRHVDPDLVDSSLPEHNEMRRLIMHLRETPPQGLAHDAALMTLMREVMRHVAEEETLLLPEAERAVPGELAALGTRMMKRRLELALPRTGELARNGLRALPGSFLAVSGALVVGAFLAGLALTRARALALPVRTRARPGLAARLRARLPI